MDLKIPKRSVPVEIAVRDVHTSVKNYFLFLNLFSPNHSGEETVEEYLNSNIQFIPLKDIETEEFYILNVNEILYVKEKDIYEEEVPKEYSLKVIFTNEQEITVDQFEPLPQFHSRPVDFLNINKNLFLPFIKDKYRIYLNRNRIKKVRII